MKLRAIRDRDTDGGTAPDFAEPVIGRRFAPTRWLHPGYAASRIGPLFGRLWRNDHTRVESHSRCLFRPRFCPYWIPPLWLAGIGFGGTRWGCNMSIDCAGISCVEAKAKRIRIGASLVSAAAVRNVIRLFAVALAGALLAACAQSSVVTKNSEFVAASREAPVQHHRTASLVTSRRVASVKKHTPFAPPKNAGETKLASQGLASFYTEGTQTASGEKFDTHELTAAHPTLPFGTRLRVTNVASGRSVTVRVNDRGPYVPGRIVDVSYSAADALGMVGGGIAKVRLDVVQ